jgi:hypothetical protein
VTYDNNSGKALKSTPKDGCCDINRVYLSTTTAAGSAHLEPDFACQIPNY